MSYCGDNPSPFGMVYTALVDMALAHPRIGAAVKAGNVIRFDNAQLQHVEKGTVSPGDLPELMLTAASHSANLFDTSSTSQITRNYTWMLSTGNMVYAPYLSDLEFDLFCAMHGWKEKIASLRWKDEAFVKRVNIDSGSVGLSDPAANRNIRGWSALFNVSVLCYFRSQYLINEYSPPGDD